MSREQAAYSRAVRERIRGTRFPPGSRPPTPKPLRQATPKPAKPPKVRQRPQPKSRFVPVTLNTTMGPLGLTDMLRSLPSSRSIAVVEDARVAMESSIAGFYPSPDQLHELWETRHATIRGNHLTYIPRRHLRIRGVGTVYDTGALTRRMEAEPYAARLAVVEEVCRELGIKPHTYDGLGPLAAAWLGKYDTHRLNWQAGVGLEDRFARAYYGGRVEGMQHGSYSGKVYHYDISSAYPWAMTRTPRMGPRWQPCAPESNGALLYRVTWKCREAPFYPLPFRQADGSLCWPRQGSAYIWRPEYLILPGTWWETVEAWQSLDDSASPYPLAAPMRELWRWRQYFEDAGLSDHATLVKGIMQASFGKLMQQWGGLPGRTYNLAWAGYATSIVRAEVYALMATDPEAVIACQTDAIWSTRPLAVPPNFGGLGRWRETVHEAGSHHFAPTAGQYRLADGTEGHMGLHAPIEAAEWKLMEKAGPFYLARAVEAPVSLGWAVMNCAAASSHTCADRLGRVETMWERIPTRATSKRFTTDERRGGLWQTEAAVVRGESQAYDSRWTSGEHQRDYAAALLLDDLSDGGR